MSEEYDYYTGQEADNMTASDSTVRYPKTDNWKRAKALDEWKKMNGICAAAKCDSVREEFSVYCKECGDFFFRDRRRAIY